MNYKKYLIEEIAAPLKNAIVGGPFGSDLTSSDYTSQGVPVIRGQNMASRWVSGEFVFVSPEKAASLSSNLATPGDLVFTQRGTLGQVALVPSGNPNKYLVSQSQMKLTPNPAIANPLYLYYLFQTQEQQTYIKNNAISTGVPHTNLGILKKTPIELPEINHQKLVSHILGNIDDKIEVLNKQNQTLESIAQALFQHWFVDFEFPDANGQPYRSSGGEMKETELGEIPISWQVGEFQDVIVLQRGFDLPSDQRIDGKYFVIAASGPSTSHHEARVCGPGIVTGRSGLLGRVFLVLEDFWPLNTTLWVKDFKNSNPFHAYFYLKQFDLNMYNSGSAVPTLNRNHLHSTPTIVSDSNINESFRLMVEPMYRKIRNNQAKIQTLTTLRDTLLPKLMSGELRIQDAEEMLAEMPEPAAPQPEQLALPLEIS